MRPCWFALAQCLEEALGGSFYIFEQQKTIPGWFISIQYMFLGLKIYHNDVFNQENSFTEK